MRTFEIAYAPRWGRIMRLLGVGPRRSEIQLDGDTLRVRLGWAFDVIIPNSSIVDARRISDSEALARVGSLGAHTVGGGTWIVNGSFRSWVRIVVDPPARGRVLGFSVTVRELHLTVVEPEELLAALEGH